MRALRGIAVVGLAACHVNDTPVDAPQVPDATGTRDAVMLGDTGAPDGPSTIDLTCFGQPFPTMAAPSVDVSGNVVAPDAAFNTVPVVGAQVEACLASSTSCQPLGVTMTDSMGDFVFPLPTAGMPLAAYVRVSQSPELTTYFYPPSPFAAAMAMAPMLMLEQSQLPAIAGGPVTPGDATVVVDVVDCAGMPIPAATAIVQRGGGSIGSAQPAYMGTTFVFDVPPDAVAGGTTIGATYMGLSFPAHPVTTFADGLVETLVRPGP
jgi:hypothetical protein